MSYSIPKLQELLDRTRSAFRSSLPGSDAWIWPNNVTVSAKVIAGSIFEVFGFAAYIAKMIFVSTAPDLETLVLHGNEFGLTLRPAAPAAGAARVTTTADCTVAVGAVFRRADGIQYIATAAASRIGAGTVDVAVVAETDGAATSAADGTPLEIVSGVSDDAATAAVYGDIIGGLDVEDKETFRQRILFRKRFPRHGGAASDYVDWAMTISGVTRVFVERLWAGTGTVRVFPLMDDLYENGIPTSGDIARIDAYIDTVRPAGAVVTVQAPAALPINVTISELTPDTTPVREAIIAELKEMFRRRSRVAGGDETTGAMAGFLAMDTTFSKSWIDQAISDAPGENSHVLITPIVDTPLSGGQIPTLGTVTFL